MNEAECKDEVQEQEQERAMEEYEKGYNEAQED